MKQGPFFKQPYVNTPSILPPVSDSSSLSSSRVSYSAIDVLSEAKRVLGFSPIDERDISSLQERLQIVDEMKARDIAIREFLIYEMNIPRHISEALSIVKTFTPARNPSGWTTLYAEFKDTSAVDLINQYVINLKHGNSVNLYVPHSLYPRFRTINSLAHAYCNGDIKHKTKVRYGTTDFVLLIKPLASNSRWTYASLSHLPPLELSLFDGNLTRASPPGRRRLSSKRSRSNESPQSLHRPIRPRVEDINAPPHTSTESSVSLSTPLVGNSQEATSLVSSALQGAALDLTAENPCLSSSKNNLNC